MVTQRNQVRKWDNEIRSRGSFLFILRVRACCCCCVVELSRVGKAQPSGAKVMYQSRVAARWANVDVVEMDGRLVPCSGWGWRPARANVPARPRGRRWCAAGGCRTGRRRPVLQPPAAHHRRPRGRAGTLALAGRHPQPLQGTSRPSISTTSTLAHLAATRLWYITLAPEGCAFPTRDNSTTQQQQHARTRKMKRKEPRDLISLSHFRTWFLCVTIIRKTKRNVRLFWNAFFLFFFLSWWIEFY